MGKRSGFWAAEAAFHFQLRHPSACLKFKPYHHRTVRLLDGPVDASYDVPQHSTGGIMSTLNQAVRQLQAKRRQTERELEQINQAIKALTSMGGSKSKTGPKPGRKKYKMSRAGRLAIARAKKAWWAKKKAGK
jgi:hypothetical protein